MARRVVSPKSRIMDSISVSVNARGTGFPAPSEGTALALTTSPSLLIQVEPGGRHGRFAKSLSHPSL